MADYAKQQQQKIKEATEQLEAGIKDFFSSGNFQEYLNVMSRFHTYSYSNSIMIAMQKPDATLLAGYSGWQKKFERHVKSGERGIKIFAPAPVKVKMEREKKDPETDLPELDENGEPIMETVEIKTPKFKVVTVFDVSQTDGKPLPSLEIDELTGNVENYDQFFDALNRTSAVPISFEEMDGETNGYYSLSDKRIAIREGMSEAQTIKTTVHELAHSRLHDFDRTKPPVEAEKRKDRNTREVEAESIAYVVCQHFGIDTSDYSFGYVATWSANRELPELKASLQTIRDAASSLINDIEQNLEVIQKEYVLNNEEDKNISEDIAEPSEIVEENHFYRYYITPEALSQGTYPYHEGSRIITTPDQRSYENDTISAVGYIDFPEQLPEDQISYYNLIPSNENPILGTLTTEQPQRNEWKYYIVPDLMTWARPDLEKERTEIEYFDQFDAAVTRFRELRTESYNFEETHSETSDAPYARLTFGIEHDDEFPCAVDLLHVRAGKNVLVEDFTKMELVTESPEAMDILSDLGSQIGFDNVLVNRNMTPDEIKQFTYEHFKFKLEQNGVPQVESYLSSFDQLYDEGQLDNMKPTANQQRISEFKEFTEWDNPYFEVQDTPDRLATDLAVFMTVYDPYTDANKNGAEKYAEIHNNITDDNTDYLKDWLSSIAMDKDEFSEQAAALSERLEKFCPTQKLIEQSSEISTPEPVSKSESRLTFYVAECSEFPTLGELHENLTLDEAIRIYHEIPPERMNGIKGIGFNLEDGSMYDGQMDLMSGGVVHTDIINAIDHYRENPEIQQAMEKLKSVFDVPEYDQTQAPQEAVFEINDNYLHIQSASDSSWDYTYYNPSMEVIDGGQIGDESMRFSQARSEILSLLDIPDAPLKPISIEEFEDMLDAHENDFHCPVYHKDLKQAREDGEMDKWRISHNATMACAEQFRNGYERAYENRQVPQFLHQMIDRYIVAQLSRQKSKIFIMN